MQRGELIYLVHADLTVEHTQRVVSVSFSCCLELSRTDDVWILTLFKAIVGDLVSLSLVLNQVVDLALG